MGRKLHTLEIAVVGDLILDKYIQGSVERISPEAPIPVVQVEKERYVPGGAANTASNISALGGRVSLFGIVGSDADATALLQETKKREMNTLGVIQDASRLTTRKIRVIAQQQQLVRIDYEDTSYIDGTVLKALHTKIDACQSPAAWIVSDYAKGVITENMMQLLKSKASKIVVDPKPQHKSWYKDVYLITPNRKEAEEMVGFKLKDERAIQEAGRQLSEELNTNVLITMGEKGMALFEKNQPSLHIPTVAKEVFDVSGAGDTVVATLTLAVASGFSLSEAAKLANQAAGIKVGKLGTAAVNISELQPYL